MLAVRALLCREVAPLQRALQRVLGRSNASAPKVLAASSKLQAAQQAGLPQCLRVGLSHGWSAKPFSSATEQQRQADIVHVDVQPQEKDLHEGGVQSLASLKAAAEAHVPSGTANIGTIPILSLNGETVGSFELPADIFGQDIRRDILQRVVRWQLAKRQQGTHSTKGRSEVRGGGRKPIPQKKTGNARAGSIRSPLWRGGGVIHGPRPRSHAIGLQKKIRRLGMKVALSAKAKEGRLIILDSAYVESGKTRDVAAHVSVLLANAPRQSILFCDSGKEAPDGGKMLRRSIRNLIWVDALPSQGLNVYSILQRDYLAITAEAAYRLMERLRRPIQR